MIIIEIMRFFNILIIGTLLSLATYSQTLFEDSLTTSTKSPIKVTSSTKTKLLKKSRSAPRLLSTNLESLIARGDIHFLYEVPQQNGWSTMVFAHANPQSEFNKQTGDLGASAGARLYLDQNKTTNPIFLQGLIGFNHISSWDLMIAVEIGQRLKWKDNVFMDISLAINRSYDSKFKSPMAYIKSKFNIHVK